MPTRTTCSRKTPAGSTSCSRSDGRSGVYTVDACPEQLVTFESNIQKKRPLMELAEKMLHS